MNINHLRECRATDPNAPSCERCGALMVAKSIDTGMHYICMSCGLEMVVTRGVSKPEPRSDE